MYITRNVINLLRLLRFIINWEKSTLTPQQKIRFLGFLIDSVQMTLTVPKEKLERIQQVCREIRRAQSVTVWQLA